MFNNSNVKTSDSAPLFADFFNSKELKIKGKLGMTFAPGKKAYSYSQNIQWDRDVEKDLKQLKSNNGIFTLLTHMEKIEFKYYKIEDLPKKGEEMQIEQIIFEIVDGYIPTDFEKYQNLVQQIITKIQEGQTIIVHCMGGLGRTGSFAACCLIELVYDADNAILLTRKTRARTIENLLQEQFVNQYYSVKQKQN